MFVSVQYVLPHGFNRDVCLYLHVYVLRPVSSWWVDGFRWSNYQEGNPLETLASCTMPPCLLFVTVLLSKPLATLQPTKVISPPCFTLLQSVSLACSHSMPAPAGLRDQEPGLPWQLVLPLSLDGSTLNVFPDTSNSPQHTQTKDTYANFFTYASSAGFPVFKTNLSLLYFLFLTFFICLYSLQPDRLGSWCRVAARVRWN